MVLSLQTHPPFIRPSSPFLPLWPLCRYGFDGIDLDWEFPSDASQRSQLSSLLYEMRSALDSAKASSGAGLLLTAAVSSGNGAIQQTYDVSVLAKTLDWVNIMTYDMAGEHLREVGVLGRQSGGRLRHASCERPYPPPSTPPHAPLTG